MVDIARPSNTLGLREEVLRLEEELKIRQWQEQQLAIADGCDVCSSAYSPGPSACVTIEESTCLQIVFHM